MMTPTHYLTARRLARSAFPGDRRAQAAACAGAVLPDLYYWARGLRLALRHRRWDPAYVDCGRDTRWPDKALHSVIPSAALLGAATARRDTRLAALGTAWLGHVLIDMLMHDGSARPPAWPLADWRVRSRLATDEPGHHAGLVLAFEVLLCAASAMPAQHVKVPSQTRTAGQGTADRRAMQRAFRQSPRNVGTLWVTSDRSVRELLDLADVDWRTIERIEEAGAGTGAFTRRILEYAGPATVLDVYERNPDLHQIVDSRYGHDPRVRLHGDAGDMENILAGAHQGVENVVGQAYADVIVSALPWTSMGEAARERLLAMFGRCLRPESGVLIAIQYSRHQEPAFRRHFEDVRYVRGRYGWPVLYRLARPRGNPDAA
jgi:phospholipid N-methyltransferase